MTIYCPRCRDIVICGDAVNGMVQCPKCLDWFEEPKRFAGTDDLSAETIQHPPAPAPAPKSAPYPTKSASSLRNVGDNFAVFALLFCIVGFWSC
jgi:hypothetical protein